MLFSTLTNAGFAICVPRGREVATDGYIDVHSRRLRLQPLRQNAAQLEGIDRLEEVSVHSDFTATVQVLLPAVAADGEDQGVMWQPSQPGRHFPAVYFGHAQVQQDGI